MSEQIRSILRVDLSENKAESLICDSHKCKGELFQVAYSYHHAGVLGWRRILLDLREAEAFGRAELFLCPDCATPEETNDGN